MGFFFVGEYSAADILFVSKKAISFVSVNSHKQLVFVTISFSLQSAYDLHHL